LPLGVLAAVGSGVVGLVLDGGGGVEGLYVPVYYASAVGGGVVGLAFAARRLYYIYSSWKWCCKVGVCGV
jgi:hypothetical protein